MITNKDAIELFNIGSVSEIFVSYLKQKGFGNESINPFLIKSKQIYERLSLKKKNILFQFFQYSVDNIKWTY